MGYGLNQSMQCDQRLVMNMGMRRAFEVLQMPIAELSDWLEREIEQNPTLEIAKRRQGDLSYLEMTIPQAPSQREHLAREIQDHFDGEKEREIAEYIGGSLDVKGFLTLSVEELSSALNVEKSLVLNVLRIFQRMEPVGLGTEGVREALLVQLEVRGLKRSVLYSVVEQYYTDLLHSRLKKISKMFGLSTQELKSLIASDLRPLTPFPGHFFLHPYNPSITPDITVEKENDMWKIEVRELPSFRIQPSCLRVVKDKSLKGEDLKYIRRHVAEGKWLSHILERRQSTLEKIMAYILKKQADFLEGTLDTPLPMTMCEIAAALEKSESTITRAIAHKYVASPIGLLKLRSFFTQAIVTDKGVVSNKKAKDLLVKWIAQEEKPLSDEALSKRLKAEGIPCARRTVAKYRQGLNILKASTRKAWK